MREIDESSLESSISDRFTFLAEFMGFGESDIKAIHDAAGLLGPLVPQLVDGVYDKLHEYSLTWRHFLVPQHGYDGEVPEKLGDLTRDHPLIQFRKQHLARYLEALVTQPYDLKFLQYIDMVGKIHTSDAGSSAASIPLVQMNALLGFVADVFNATILGADIPDSTKYSTLRAFSKLLWIQNDFINRHYRTA